VKQFSNFRSIYALAIPAAGSFILSTLYSVNDFFWAGRLGPAAISALGLVMMPIIFNAGLMALVHRGAMSAIARLTGLGQEDRIRHTAVQALLLNLLLSLFFSATGWLLAPRLLSMMGGHGDVLALATQYLRLLYLGFPFMSAAMVLDGQFIGLGDTKTPLRLQLLGVCVNTALNAFTVLVLGAGITGIALASIFSRSLAGVIGSIILARRLRRPGELLPTRRELRPALHLWREFLRVGTPVSLSIIFYAAIFMVLNRILGQFGQIAYGVIGVGIRGIESIGFMVLLGFGAAASTLVGRRVGELAKSGENLHSIQELISNILLATLPISLIFSLAWWFIPEALCGIYTQDAELIALSAVYLRMAAVANIFQLVEMIIYESMVGAGVADWPLRITVPANLLRIPLALALTTWTDLGINGVWIAILISSILKAIGMGSLFLFSRWKQRAVQAATQFGLSSSSSCSISSE
jgi:putative MATE family efflux protein